MGRVKKTLKVWQRQLTSLRRHRGPRLPPPSRLSENFSPINRNTPPTTKSCADIPCDSFFSILNLTCVATTANSAMTQIIQRRGCWGNLSSSFAHLSALGRYRYRREERKISPLKSSPRSAHLPSHQVAKPASLALLWLERSVAVREINSPSPPVRHHR